MLDAAFQPHLTALQSEKLVVLVLPELLDGLPDLKQLRASFDGEEGFCCEHSCEGCEKLSSDVCAAG